MSYDITLTGAGPVSAHEDGGTFVLGGTDAAELNVTYNYARVYKLLGFSLRDLNGKRAGETAPQLKSLVDALGTNQYDDYWAPTPGNAGYALNRLLEWAGQYPDGVWEVR